MPEKVVDHYNRHAHAYDLARRKGFTEKPWFERFLIGLPKGSHILDLGCGAGEPVARCMIDAGFNVTGVDISDKMIALARIRFARHRWFRMDMRAAAMDRKFHGIVAWDSLFYLRREEQAAMIVRAAGWLEPGGMLLFSSDPPEVPVAARSSEALHRAGLSPAEIRYLFYDLGIEELAFSPNDSVASGRSVWLARKL